MKKFWMYFLIVIGVILLACLSLATVLILMPGKEIFGIKYVSAVVGDYKGVVSQTFNSQDIYIYAYDVPINFTFAEPGNLGVEFVQQYQGYTRAKDTPSIKLKNRDGNDFNPDQDTDAVYIYISQYKKFIWSNGQRDFYLNINVPASYKTNGNIYIETTSSDITLSGASKTLHSLTIKTDGEIKLENKLYIQNLKIETKNDVEIGDNIKIKPLSTGGVSSVEVSIPHENLTIVNAVENGDIIFRTSSGNLNFNTCRNLEVYSSSGSIKQPTAQYIGGSLKFETSSGSVEIDSVQGTSNSIKSVSGNIKLGFCAGELSIVTNRSNVYLSTVKNAEIQTTTGNISVTYVKGNISASSSRSGSIECGTIIGSADFETNKGNITVSGAVGGNLSMIAKTGELKLVSCKNLVAKSSNGSLVGFNNCAVVVNGVAEIDIKKGDVKISKILGTSALDFDNTIFCDKGDLIIDTIAGTASISSENSNMTINKTGFVNISSSYSDVTILSAPAGATINNLGGDIIVGNSQDASQSTGKLTIISGTGAIYAYNTVADVYLCSDKSVNLQNKSSAKIYINTTPVGDTTGTKTASGSVVATNLQGEVRVASQNNVSLSFSKISGNVRVDTKGASKLVVINAQCAKKSSVNYLVQSSKGSINELYVGDAKEQASRLISTIDKSYPTITVYTTQASTRLELGV